MLPFLVQQSSSFPTVFADIISWLLLSFKRAMERYWGHLLTCGSGLLTSLLSHSLLLQIVCIKHSFLLQACLLSFQGRNAENGSQCQRGTFHIVAGKSYLMISYKNLFVECESLCNRLRILTLWFAVFRTHACNVHYRKKTEMLDTRLQFRRIILKYHSIHSQMFTILSWLDYV